MMTAAPRSGGRPGARVAEGEFAVYDGRDYLGEVVTSASHIKARLVDGTDLGSFATLRAAQEAIKAAAAVAGGRT